MGVATILLLELFDARVRHSVKPIIHEDGILEIELNLGLFPNVGILPQYLIDVLKLIVSFLNFLDLLSLFMGADCLLGGLDAIEDFLDPLEVCQLLLEAMVSIELVVVFARALLVFPEELFDTVWCLVIWNLFRFGTDLNLRGIGLRFLYLLLLFGLLWSLTLWIHVLDIRVALIQSLLLFGLYASHQLL